ncbi:MAG TPA: hypothetical protein VFV84_11925 [Burkholderiales bacterium]|nr:hypothetical protein [Burkholderiales bacterium]
MRSLLAAALALCALGAPAQPHSAGECREGGDFIRNAALARDAGATRDFFVGKLEEDFVAVRAFPPGLRWFVHDAADEDFLRAEVYAVFDDPAASERHRDAFLERCARRAERLAHGAH